MNQREMTRKMYQQISHDLLFNEILIEHIRIITTKTGSEAEGRRIEKARLDLSDRLLNKSKVLK